MTQPKKQLKESDKEERLVRIRHFWGNSDFEIRKGEALAKHSIIEEAKSDINFLLEENKRLTQEIESHGPEGRNYTNEQYVALRLELEQVKAERDMWNEAYSVDTE